MSDEQTPTVPSSEPLSTPNPDETLGPPVNTPAPEPIATPVPPAPAEPTLTELPPADLPTIDQSPESPTSTPPTEPPLATPPIEAPINQPATSTPTTSPAPAPPPIPTTPTNPPAIPSTPEPAPTNKNIITTLLAKARSTIQARKQARLHKILTLLVEKPRTSRELSKLLKKSRYTVARDMNELEKQSKVRQIGKIGHAVRYELIH